MVRDHARDARTLGPLAFTQASDRISSSRQHSSAPMIADAPAVDAEQARLRRLLALAIVRTLLPDDTLRRTYLRDRWHGK
jgi:hypothetical protein